MGVYAAEALQSQEERQARLRPQQWRQQNGYLRDADFAFAFSSYEDALALRSSGGRCVGRGRRKREWQELPLQQQLTAGVCFDEYGQAYTTAQIQDTFVPLIGAQLPQ